KGEINVKPFETEFNALLTALPTVQNRNFEQLIAEFVLEQEEQELLAFQRFLEKNLMDGENLREKYIAFLCLATVFRRNEHHTELKLLFQKYGKQFENESLYFHYKALMHKANQEF